MLYNTQELLFNVTPKISSTGNKDKENDSFVEKGFTVLDSINSPDEARYTLDSFISNINPDLFEVHAQFTNRIQLAKADAIPVCCDSVETSFQALHFDMGQPLSGDNQLFINIIGLYHPLDENQGLAKTRVLPLKGLLKEEKWGSEKEVEEKILKYVNEYGDGWDATNTFRLSCFARIIDALTSGTALRDYRGKTMAEWFSDSLNESGESKMKREQEFYSKNNLPIEELEEQVNLKSGQLLIIDNTRVAHGRIGKRNEKEIYQFMYGVPNTTDEEIKVFRENIIALLKS